MADSNKRTLMGFQYRERAEPFAANVSMVFQLSSFKFQYRERAEPFAATLTSLRGLKKN